MTLQQYFQAAPAMGLTIVSVCFRSTALLRQNLALMRHLNPDTPIYWLVVQNTPEPERAEELQEDDPDFYVIPGPLALSTERNTVAYGSLHHAKALNIAVAYATTQHLLIIDPDCFIVLPRWLQKVPALMKKESLMFWGTPYHPERLGAFNVFGRTYHYFPTGICLFINRRALHQQHRFDLDFTPPVSRSVDRQQQYHQQVREICQATPKLWPRILQLVSQLGWGSLLTAWRLTCRKWSWDPRRDIGHHIYERYHRTVKYGYTAIYYARKIPLLFRLCHWAIPQALTAYPKRRHYWLTTPFPFIPEPVQQRWEQFLHQGRPFAFHVGKVTYNPFSEDQMLLAQVLQQLLQTPLPPEK